MNHLQGVDKEIIHKKKIDESGHEDMNTRILRLYQKGKINDAEAILLDIDCSKAFSELTDETYTIALQFLVKWLERTYLFTHIDPEVANLAVMFLINGMKLFKSVFQKRENRAILSKIIIRLEEIDVNSVKLDVDEQVLQDLAEKLNSFVIGR